MSFTVLDSIERADKNVLKENFALDALTGFSSRPKFLPSKYFYDKKGSEIFQKITETEDYYPTRSEFDVFNTHHEELINSLPKKFSLVELGAGDGRKTKILLQKMLDKGLDFEYLPIDISEAAIDGLSNSLKEEMPSLNTHGVVGEYVDGINWVNQNRQGPKVVFFLGSNIGNFNQTQSLVFLRVIWKTLNHGDSFLIGFDLKKDIDVMLSAYNDSEKHTYDFNLNVLARMNNELGANFDLSKFQHFGTYNPSIGAMESYIISMENQEVYIGHLEKTFEFKAFEPIHMEYSYKYLRSEIDFLATETGYKVENHFSDKKNYFVDSLWTVIKE